MNEHSMVLLVKGTLTLHHGVTHKVVQHLVSERNSEETETSAALN